MYGVWAWSYWHLANGNKYQSIHGCHFKNFVARGSHGFVRENSSNRSRRVEQPSVLNKFFFQNYNILPCSGVRAECLRAGSQNMTNFVTFWPNL